MAHQQEQGVSSPKHKTSARTAAQSGSSQEHQGPTSSRRFKPAQQAVAEALLAVMKRPVRGGKQAMCAARLILVTNNLETCPLLEMLPEAGPLPTVQQLQQRASDELLQSLTELARQCAAAQCQPLEVFKRSLQCKTHRAAAHSIAAKRKMHRKLQQKKLHPRLPGWRQSFLQSAHDAGVQQILADLVVSFLAAQTLYNVDEEAAALFQPYLDHMLPGAVDTLQNIQKAGMMPDDLLRATLNRLIASFTTALQAYHVQAAQSGQSYEHTVLLEAVVQGWLLDTPHVGDLLRAMIAAEDPINPTRPKRHADARQGASSAAPKIAAFQEPGPQNYAVSYLKECSPDVLAILKRVISVLDLSDKDLSPIPARNLATQDKRLKALLAGLFPGITEELYCAIDKKNAGMCRDLAKAAGRHVESFIQVWRQEAKEKEISLPQLLDGKVDALGFSPSELPAEVEGAIYDLSAKLRAEPPVRVLYHYFTTTVVSMMHGMIKPGVEESSYFWLLKAAAQQMALRINHAEEVSVLDADQFLVTGPNEAMLNSKQLGPEITNEGYIVLAWHMTRVVVLEHALAAQARGKSLRAHLEDVAGYRTNRWGAGKPDVGHLIAILADRVGAKEGPPGEAWRKLTHEAPGMAGVMERAFKVPDAMGLTKYAALCSIFPGLPRVVPANYQTECGSQLLQNANLVKQQLQVHMHIASVQQVPFRQYMERLLTKHSIDTLQRAGGSLHEAICQAADSLKVDVAMVKLMHIQMCVKNVMFGKSPADAAAAWGDPYLVLLSKLMDTCTAASVRPKLLKAIGQALPGVLDCLTKLHEWPHGFDEDQAWLSQATGMIHRITAQHARDAHDLGIQPREHIRKALAVPGLKDQEAELLMGIFEELWGDQKREEYDRRTKSMAETAKTMSAFIGRY